MACRGVGVGRILFFAYFELELVGLSLPGGVGNDELSPRLARQLEVRQVLHADVVDDLVLGPISRIY